MYLSRWYNQNNFVTGIIKTINKFNKKKIIDVVTFVDSFGAMTPEKVNNFFYFINGKKLKNINIGCHFHNNCNLALANALVAINNCQFVDLTFLGFGRGAGNAETELFLVIKFAKASNITDFDLGNLIEKLQIMKDDLKWGSSFAYAFAASNGFSQSEIMDLIVKRRLSPATAANILGKNNSKSRFYKFKNLNYIKKIFLDKKNIPLFVGGGPRLVDQGRYFFSNINKKIPIVFSGSTALMNFIKLNFKIPNPKILILTGEEHKRLFSNLGIKVLNKINLVTIIAETTFLPKNLKFKKIKIVASNTVALNALMLFGIILKRIRQKTLHLCFFDGNSKTLSGRMVMDETQESLAKLNKMKLNIFNVTQNFLKARYKNIWINDK